MKHSGFRCTRLALACAAAIAVFAAGCTVGPDYRRASPGDVLPAKAPSVTGVPNELQADAALPSPAWWRAFDDPDLDGLVEVALSHSPDLEAAAAAVRQSRAALSQASSAAMPQVNLQGRVGRDQVSTDSEGYANIPFANPQSLFTDYRAGLDASWEVDLFGHTRRAIEAADAQAEVAVAQKADVALRVSAETARNVLDWRHFQLRTRNAQAVADQRARLLELVRQQRKSGVASDIEVRQAEAAWRGAQAAVPPLQIAADACVVALVPLTGLARNDISARLHERSEAPRLPEARTFAVDSTVLERRPDIRQAERRLASATAAVGMAVADQYPRFTLVGSFGFDAIKPAQLGEQASQYWSVGPQFYLPLFNGGRVDSVIRQNEAARDAAIASYRKSVLAALADVEAAMLRCKGDAGHLQGMEDAYVALDQQFALTGARVKAGVASQLDLLSADLSRLNQAELRLAARQSLADDIVLLYRSLDGGAPTTAEAPTAH